MLSLILSLALSQTILDATNKSLEVVTTTTAPVDFFCSYVDYAASTVTPADTQGAITTATTTTYISAPASSTQRQMRRCSFRNKSTTTSNRLTFQKRVGVTAYEGYSAPLAPGESVKVDAEGEWAVYDSSGILRVPANSVIDGRTVSFLKVGAASEAAGLFQLMNKDTGMPGAWVPGTPGLNGDHVACNTTADATIAGATFLPDPASGNYFLTSATAGVSVASMPFMADLLWFNTGLAVATTTAQAITFGTLNARDQNGSTNGEGVYAAILVTTATTNAGAITNTTMSYTNSDGTPTRTATIASFPATAVAGAFIPFQLAAGDRGIRSIESVTLGTTYGGGAISLVVYRPLVFVPGPVVNVGGTMSVVNAAPSGIKLWNGSCLNVGYLASGTGATTLQLSANLTVR
jgi:hypothetical protein